MEMSAGSTAEITAPIKIEDIQKVVKIELPPNTISVKSEETTP
jgi:hypothetical protein